VARRHRRVLDDPALRLAYHDPSTPGFREPDGAELIRPLAASGRTWVPSTEKAGLWPRW
jgi:hypothetical protein